MANTVELLFRGVAMPTGPELSHDLARLCSRWRVGLTSHRAVENETVRLAVDIRPVGTKRGATPVSMLHGCCICRHRPEPVDICPKNGDIAQPPCRIFRIVTKIASALRPNAPPTSPCASSIFA